MAFDIRLEQLFRECDQDENGYIDKKEFRCLCGEFGISEIDSDIIFADLDHDGDGTIDFEDFSYGFRDFLVPGSRRGSIQISLCTTKVVNEKEKQKSMEEKHVLAQKAWKNFAENMSKDDTKRFLAKSSDKILGIYGELKESNASPEIIENFEEAIHFLLKDVKRLETDQIHLEEQFQRERENHSAHLASIEADLEIQLTKVETAAREKAKQDYEIEKTNLKEKMEAEIMELQSHLRLFEKVDDWINKEDQSDLDAKRRLEDANKENKELKNLVAETSTNITLLKSEMTQLRNSYESKVNELTSEKENMMEYVLQYENLQRQLQLLHDANRKLQDTNDSIMGLIDSSNNRQLEKEISTEKTFTLNRLMDDLDSGIMSTTQEFECSDENRAFELEKFQKKKDDAFEFSKKNMDYSRKNEAKENHLPSNIEKRFQAIQLTKALSTNSSFDFDCRSQSMLPTGPPDRTYKVVFAGDAAVGKTSFINRITKGIFLQNLSSTLGVDFQVKTIRVDERNIAIQLWDTAGQERFRSVTKTYFRRADGVMLLFDVTSERSFASVRHWIQSIDEVTEKRIPIILCGNKIDQRDLAILQNRRVVKSNEGEKMAKEYSALFLETSSKDGSNVNDSLVLLAREMCSNEDVEVQSSALKLRDIESKNNCCSGKKKI